MIWNTPISDCTQMFYKLTNIISIDLSKFDSSSVTLMDYMFSYCSSLISINFDNINTNSVTSMSYMFSYCASLTNLDLSEFKTSNNKNMNSMFENCYSLSSLDLSNFNTSSVESIKFMFSYCTSLTYLNLRNFNIKSISTSLNMLNECNNNLIYCINLTNNEPIKKNFNSFPNNNCSFFISKQSEVNESDIYKEEVVKNTDIITIFLNYNENNDTIPKEQDLNNTYNDLIKKCDIKCQNCSLLENKNNLCISCNNKEGYYQKLNYNLNNNSFVECYKNLNGYYLNDDN